MLAKRKRRIGRLVSQKTDKQMKFE